MKVLWGRMPALDGGASDSAATADQSGQLRGGETAATNHPL